MRFFLLASGRISFLTPFLAPRLAPGRMLNSLARQLPKGLLRLRAHPSASPTSSCLRPASPVSRGLACLRSHFVRSFAVSSLRAAGYGGSVDDIRHESIASDSEHEVARSQDDSLKTFQDLADRGMVDAKVINTITQGMGYSEMTKVQRNTIAATVAGVDV